MCNLNRIAALLLSATIAVSAALLFYVSAAALAGSWYTAASNIWVLGACAVLIGIAMAFVNGALIEAVKCQTGPCKTSADRLFGALFALDVTLGALLTATVIAAFAASIAYVGVGVAIGVGVTAAAVGVSLALVSGTYLPALDACRVASAGAAPSAAVQVQKTAGVAVGIALIVFGAGVLGVKFLL